MIKKVDFRSSHRQNLMSPLTSSPVHVKTPTIEYSCQGSFHQRISESALELWQDQKIVSEVW
jgi:hypothetical protein